MTDKQKLIQFLEDNGEQSTGKLEDFMRTEFGTLGSTTTRRLREMVRDGILIKEQRDFEGKKYFAYRVKPEIYYCGKHWGLKPCDCILVNLSTKELKLNI